jgi:hypothetical protein
LSKWKASGPDIVFAFFSFLFAETAFKTSVHGLLVVGPSKSSAAASARRP